MANRFPFRGKSTFSQCRIVGNSFLSILFLKVFVRCAVYLFLRDDCCTCILFPRGCWGLTRTFVNLTGPTCHSHLAGFTRRQAPSPSRAADINGNGNGIPPLVALSKIRVPWYRGLLSCTNHLQSERTRIPSGLLPQSGRRQ
jgi:hypothetical protein